jgi:hypothetical membrane protein
MTERRFAWCGVLAPIVFILALVVFSSLRPNYSQLTHAVSEFGFAGVPHAVTWNVIAFMLVGFLIVGLAWALASGVIGVMAVASIFIPGTVPAGLSQRIGIGTNLAWLFVTGLALLRKPAPVP